VVQGVGFEPPNFGDVSPLRFSAAFFPFFFFGENAVLSKNYLALGDIVDESKNSQLPSLRQNLAIRPVERTNFDRQEDNQVPSVWQHEKLERRKIPYSYKGCSALLLQRLRFAFFRAVNYILKNPFFFSVHSARRFSI
jgi:hypothetical protein